MAIDRPRGHASGYIGAVVSWSVAAFYACVAAAVVAAPSAHAQERGRTDGPEGSEYGKGGYSRTSDSRFSHHGKYWQFDQVVVVAGFHDPAAVERERGHEVEHEQDRVHRHQERDEQDRGSLRPVRRRTARARTTATPARDRSTRRRPAPARP